MTLSSTSSTSWSGSSSAPRSDAPHDQGDFVGLQGTARHPHNCSTWPRWSSRARLTCPSQRTAQRRAGHRCGLLPWAALAVGTAASLAANVAVGSHDLLGRALAGWPAISLLVSIKLLFSMFGHAKDDQWTVPDGPPGTISGRTHTVRPSRGRSSAPSAADADRTPGAPGATPDSVTAARGAARRSRRVGGRCRGMRWPTGGGTTGTACPTSARHCVEDPSGRTGSGRSRR
jgi:hypothetical protein